MILNDKIKYDIKDFKQQKFFDYLVIFRILLHKIGKMISEENREITSSNWLYELMLADEIKKTIQELVAIDGEYFVDLLKISIKYQDLWKKLRKKDFYKIVTQLFADEDIQKLLNFNEFENNLWFSKEGFDDFVNALLMINLVAIRMDESFAKSKSYRIRVLEDFVEDLKVAEEKSGYLVEEFLKEI